MAERKPIEFLFNPNPDSPTMSAVSIKTSINGHNAYLGIDFSLLIDRTEFYEHLQELIEKHFPTLNYLAGTYPYGKVAAERLGREFHVAQVELLDYGRDFIRPERLNPKLNRVVILDLDLGGGKQVLRAAQVLAPDFNILGVAAFFDWRLPSRQSRFKELGLKTQTLVGIEQVFQHIKSNEIFPPDLVRKAISGRRHIIRSTNGMAKS